MKQAQSMGLNLVIIAAIALLVLVIIAILVVGSGGDINEGLRSCPVMGGQCMMQPPMDAAGSYTEVPDATGCQEGYRCYVRQ